MNCFECAKTNDDVPAVGVCRHCGVGLCLDHLVEAHEYHVGGTPFGCAHDDAAREAAARRSRRDRRRRAASHRGRRMSTASSISIAPDQRDQELARLAKALGHPTRVRILRLLLSRDACYCGQLVDELPLAQATVSQHLKVLKDAGLIIGEIDGLRTCYCASRDRLANCRSCSAGLLAEAVGGRQQWLRLRRPSFGAKGRARRRGGAEEALDARPVPAALDRARDGRAGLGLGTAHPEPERLARASCRSEPSRCRSRSGCS